MRFSSCVVTAHRASIMRISLPRARWRDLISPADGSVGLAPYKDSESHWVSAACRVADKATIWECAAWDALRWKRRFTPAIADSTTQLWDHDSFN